jgi:hypothetical protein
MNRAKFGRYKKGDRASARDFNRRANALEGLMRSMPDSALLDSSGVVQRNQQQSADSSLIVYGKVITSLRYADPSINPPTGISKYVVELESTNTPEFDDWPSGTSILTGDKVIYEATDDTDNYYLYEAKVDNPITPSGKAKSNGNWEWKDESLLIKGFARQSSFHSTVDWRYWLRWLESFDIIPLILKDGYYYIMQTFTPCAYVEHNDDGLIVQIQSSIRQNQSEHRMMAVCR